MRTPLTKQRQNSLMKLLALLKVEIPMEYDDIVLIAILINSEEALTKFTEWLKTKLVEEKFQTTAKEIMSTVSKIGEIVMED